MGFGDTMRKIVGLESEDEEVEITEEEVEAERQVMYSDNKERSSKSGDKLTDQKVPPASYTDKKFSVNASSSFKLVVIEPKNFDECRKLVDNLKGRKPVIINLEMVETEVARKIFDFLSGAVYALNGNVQKVASNIFIFAPENVSIAASVERNTTADFKDDKSQSPWR
ncbi:MAG: cell division protein SepF [Peptostreptococcaceae bacterium]|nr:cell division protein SepF [Peptostreptococcaceae bacterium]